MYKKGKNAEDIADLLDLTLETVQQIIADYETSQNKK